MSLNECATSVHGYAISVEVRDSADADIQLMRHRANPFKDLATSFDRELENFFNFATLPFSVPAMRSPLPREIEFVKSLCPKLPKIRRAYSSPDFSKRVMEKWSSRSRIRIDLFAIKKAIVLAEENGIMDFEKRGRRLSFWEEWKNEGEGESKDLEPIRALKIRLKEFEKHGSSFEAFKNSEFLEKVKSGLVCASSSFSDLLGFLLIVGFCVFWIGSLVDFKSLFLCRKNLLGYTIVFVNENYLCRWIVDVTIRT